MESKRSLKQRLSRREMLGLMAAAGAAVVVGCGEDDSPAETPTSAAPGSTATPAAQAATTPSPASQTLATTPACGDDDDPTPAQTEGPFFTPDSPERASLLEEGMTGQRLVVSGFVLGTDCRPVAGSLLDFWQADDAGEYDNVGYRLRGHQFAAADGSYRLETIVPGLYTGRTRHIHVKVQAPNGPVLTTQLYFPDEPDNASDGIFNPALLMAVNEAGEGLAASFRFVVQRG